MVVTGKQFLCLYLNLWAFFILFSTLVLLRRGEGVGSWQPAKVKPAQHPKWTPVCQPHSSRLLAIWNKWVSLRFFVIFVAKSWFHWHVKTPHLSFRERKTFGFKQLTVSFLYKCMIYSVTVLFVLAILPKKRDVSFRWKAQLHLYRPQPEQYHLVTFAIQSTV